MSNTYCGKDCEACEERSHLNCPGCRVGPGKAYGGDCSIAKCCTSRNLGSCMECTASTTCYNHQSRIGVAADRIEKQKDSVFLQQKLLSKCQLLNEQLRGLFWYVIVSTVFNILCWGSLVKVLPTFGFPINVIEYSLIGENAWLLLKLLPASNRYRTAGISALISALLLLGAALLGSSWLGTMLMLIAVVPVFIMKFQEFRGHSEIVEELDADLASQWRRLWYWFVGCMCVMIIARLLALVNLPIMSYFVLLVSVVGFWAIAVLRCIYLYSTVKACRDYVKKYSQIV